MKAYQCAEYARAQDVLVYCPRSNNFINYLHPAGSLYEGPISSNKVVNDHTKFQELMTNLGINVYDIQDVLLKGCETEGRQLDELRQFARNFLTYKYVTYDAANRATIECDTEDISASQSEVETTNIQGTIDTNVDSRRWRRLFYMSDEYKDEVLRTYSAQNLVNVIFNSPTVYLRFCRHNTGVIVHSIQIQPVPNLVFTRDQQITTKKGVVIGRFHTEQRRLEQRIMQFVFQKLGISPVGVMPSYTALEGGDFVILDENTAAMGIGLRSSYAAALYLMGVGSEAGELLGYKRVLVVKDVFDQDQDRMHLDCVCSPLHRRLVVLDAEILKPEKQRFVDEYIFVPETGKYKLSRANISFFDFLTSEGYEIIRLPHELQLQYGCNALNLGLIDGSVRVLSPHSQSVHFIRASPELRRYCQRENVKIDIQHVEFRGVTSMYGALHCASQVFNRVPLKDDNVVLDEVEPQLVAEPERFDHAIIIPTYLERPDLEHNLKRIYFELSQAGKRVFVCNRYCDQVFKAFSACKQKQSLEELLHEVYADPANYHEDKDDFLELSVEDCIYNF